MDSRLLDLEMVQSAYLKRLIFLEVEIFVDDARNLYKAQRPALSVSPTTSRQVDSLCAPGQGNLIAPVKRMATWVEPPLLLDAGRCHIKVARVEIAPLCTGSLCTRYSPSETGIAVPLPSRSQLLKGV